MGCILCPLLSGSPPASQRAEVNNNHATTGRNKCNGNWILDTLSYEPAQGNCELSVPCSHEIMHVY